MRRDALAICVLALSVIACGTYTLPTVAVSPTSVLPTDTVTPLSPTRTATVPTATPITPTAVVVKAFVNIHAEPDGPVSGYVESGDEIKIVKCEDNWCQIEEPAGWIWQGCTSFNPENLGCEAG